MFRDKPGFMGGVHPTNGEDKALTRDKSMIQYVPDVVNISMKQGLGPACKCVVKENEKVTQGQIIGESTHFMSSAIHSSVTGTVEHVSELECQIKTESCVLIDDSDSYYREWIDISDIDGNDIIEQMEQGGLVGMGGAGFPTHVKYKTKDKITHVLINAAECEPYLTCDERIMTEQGMALLNGVQLLKKAANAKYAIICMEDNKIHCKDHLMKLLGGHEQEIRIQILPTVYPQGSEKQLISTVTKTEIPAGALPSAVGVIVSNVETAKAAADMVLGHHPSTSRCITISGDVKNPANYLVPIGTDIGELLAQSGDVNHEVNKVILGGPMTGRFIGGNLNAEKISKEGGINVTKVSGGLIVLAGEYPAESNCIKCESCVTACPAGLSPYKIDAAIRQENIGLCDALYATECIGCGCCSYVCPAKRELTHYTVLARDTVRMKRREEASNG